MNNILKTETCVCVEGVIEKVMDEGAQLLYQNYLKQKVLPFSAKATMMTVMQPANIENPQAELKESSQFKSPFHNWKDANEAVPPGYDTWSKLTVKEPQSKVNQSQNFSERYQDSKGDRNEAGRSSVSQLMTNNSIMKRLSVGLMRRGQLLMKQASKEQPKTQSIQVKDERSPDQVKFDLHEEDLRLKKQLEERLKAAEVASRIKKIQSSKNAQIESQKLQQNLRAIKQSQNIFEVMHTRGQGITFDYDGLPILYSQRAQKKELIDSGNYKLSDEIIVTKKGIKNQKKISPATTTPNISTESSTQHKNSDLSSAYNNKQVIDFAEISLSGDKLSRLVDKMQGKSNVIESKYTQPSKNMVVAAGVELSEKGKLVAGPPIKIQNQLSLQDYAKLSDTKAQLFAAQQTQRALEKQKQSGYEDPYKEFRKFALSQSIKNQKSAQSHRQLPHNVDFQIQRAHSPRTHLIIEHTIRKASVSRHSFTKDKVSQGENLREYSSFLKDTVTSLVENKQESRNCRGGSQRAQNVYSIQVDEYESRKQNSQKAILTSNLPKTKQRIMRNASLSQSSDRLHNSNITVYRNEDERKAFQNEVQKHQFNYKQLTVTNYSEKKLAPLRVACKLKSPALGRSRDISQ